MKTTQLISCLLITLFLFSCEEPAPTAAENRGLDQENQSAIEQKKDLVGHESTDTLTQELFPEPDGYVTDITDILSEEEEQALETRLDNYEKTTSREIAIAIVDDIAGYDDIALYGKNLANAWGVGKKEQDNGLLIVLAMKIRKIRIASGLGTEQVLSDEFLKQVIDQRMVPLMRTQAYSDALHTALDAIVEEWN